MHDEEVVTAARDASDGMHEQAPGVGFDHERRPGVRSVHAPESMGHLPVRRTAYRPPNALSHAAVIWTSTNAFPNGSEKRAWIDPSASTGGPENATPAPARRRCSTWMSSV